LRGYQVQLLRRHSAQARLNLSALCRDSRGSGHPFIGEVDMLSGELDRLHKRMPTSGDLEVALVLWTEFTVAMMELLRALKTTERSAMGAAWRALGRAEMCLEIALPISEARAAAGGAGKHTEGLRVALQTNPSAAPAAMAVQYSVSERTVRRLKGELNPPPSPSAHPDGGKAYLEGFLRGIRPEPEPELQPESKPKKKS
jgi:hypothetical protein